jgi:hypothetical protein
VIPWWNTPIRSKDLSIAPNDAREFFAQLDVAFKKWQQQQKVQRPPKESKVKPA